jgi:hypothetical protein
VAGRQTACIGPGFHDPQLLLQRLPDAPANPQAPLEQDLADLHAQMLELVGADPTPVEQNTQLGAVR